MRKTEKDAQKVRRVGQIQKAILSAVATSGVLAVALVAPNALKLLRGTVLGSRLDERSRSAFSRLLKRGYLEYVVRDGKKVVRLTDEGQRVLERMHFQQTAHAKEGKSRRWDKRWRLLVFDIPEHRRAVRNRLRDLIISLGFMKIQNSVWVYPYDCEELITLLKSDLRLGREVLYAIAETIENDAWLRKHFKLQ